MPSQNELVSVPYEITLLSNPYELNNENSQVSVPYEITLLSNELSQIEKRDKVSVPYEITLLSNLTFNVLFDSLFQYLMKLHYSQTNVRNA